MTHKSNVFRILGKFIAQNSKFLIAFSFLFAAFSGGIYKLELRDEVRDGWTPKTSRSRYETAVLQEFFNASADPMRVIAVLRAKDGGSMHRLAYLHLAVQFYNYISRELTIQLDGNNFTYSQICGPYCNDNIPILYFTQTLVNFVRKGKLQGRKIQYPIARIGHQDLHLQANFYGVQLKNDGVNAANKTMNEEIQMLSQYTDIVYIKTIMMTFRANLHNEEDKWRTQKWEMAVYDYVKNNFRQNQIKAFVLSDAVVNHEVMEDGKKTAPVFVAGLILMLMFVTISILLETLYAGILHCDKLLIPFVAICCPLFAVGTTFGLWSLCGLRTNSAMLIMPLLILGIGVDDAFLTTHAWICSANSRLNAKRRIEFVVEEIGPSMTITTITNVLTFAISALTPTIEIQLFCASAAIALTITYLYTLTLFIPFLHLLSKNRQQPINENENEIIVDVGDKPANKKFIKSIGSIYCKIISSLPIRLILLLIYVVFIVFSTLELLKMRSKLDTDEILPHNSPIREPNAIISNLAWKEYYPVTIFINNPLDLYDRAKLEQFNQMLGQFERMQKCKGTNFTISWIRDFSSFCDLDRRYPFIGPISANDEEKFDFCIDRRIQMMRPADSIFDLAKLPAFLNSKFYSYYVPYMKFSGQSRPCNPVPVSKFILIVAYQNTTDWAERIELMQQWRTIADEFTDLNATVWEMNAMFVDQMLSLKSMAMETIACTILFMAIVCFVFIQSPFLVLTSIWAISSICVSVIGFLSFWGLDLNPITLCTILMCIGMSVDFTAHTAYHFHLNERQKPTADGIFLALPLSSSYSKLENCIKSIAWPMLLAGISSILAILPLAMLQNYIPLAFFKTIILVVAFGILHGLVFLPVLLYSVPIMWLHIGCFCCPKKCENSTQISNQNETMEISPFNIK